MVTHTAEDIRTAIADIPDPEIPVISISDLGILRDVTIDGKKCIVTITPTYLGCPAMKLIEDEIKSRISDMDVEVRMTYSPAWTTDWIDPEAKERLREYGIAPPSNVIEISMNEVVVCPRCGSVNTREISHYGSTACKALFQCNDCKEPFDHFKPH